MRIILASNSPRRKELLSQIGLNFEVIPSNFEENHQELEPEALVQHFAFMKAKDVFDRLKKDEQKLSVKNEDALIIGSDTIVYLDEIMGKPKDEQHAFHMLKKLSNKSHVVMTGVSVFQLSTGHSITEYQATKVTIKELSESEILNYINTGEPLDKAGAYAIQGIGSVFVAGIEGCYFNVVGLPIFKLSQIFERFGLSVL